MAASAERVIVYSYGSAAGLWWKKNHEQLQRFDKLSVIELPADQTRALANLVQRTMQVTCTIEDGTVWIGDEQNTIELSPQTIQHGQSE